MDRSASGMLLGWQRSWLLWRSRLLPVVGKVTLETCRWFPLQQFIACVALKFCYSMETGPSSRCGHQTLVIRWRVSSWSYRCPTRACLLSSFRCVLLAADWKHLERFLAWQCFRNLRALEETGFCFVPSLCFGYFDVLEVDHGHKVMLLAAGGSDSTYHDGRSAFWSHSLVDSVDLIRDVSD